MATWKKVIVSGSTANLAALQVDNLTSGQVVIGGGSSNLTTRAISGSGAILASGGSGIQLTGSFSGDLTGTASTASFVTSSNVYGPYGANSVLSSSYALTASFALNASTLNALTNGEGISAFSYNGSTAGVTVSVSGAADLTNNAITKWDNNANKFANSSLTDDGTSITGTTSIKLSGANSSLTGSFTGSFTGTVVGTVSTASFVTASNVYGPYGSSSVLSSSYALTASYAANGGVTSFNTRTGAVTLQASDISGLGAGIVSSSVISAGASQGQITDTVNGVATTITVTNLGTTGNPQFSSVTASFTGSLTGALVGTASWATNAVTATTANKVANSLTQGALVNTFTFDGSSAQTVSVATSSLAANQIPKYSGNTLSGSNISDTGTQVQIAAGAVSGLSIAAGGVTVTGNSTFNNNVTVTGDLTVAGTASFQNSTSLLIADKFALLASGSTSLTDGGIIVASTTAAGGASGSAWYLETGNGTDTGTYGRWATAFNVHASASAATVSEYAVTVNVAASADPSAAPVWGGATNGSGNMWINNTSGDIFIYA